MKTTTSTLKEKKTANSKIIMLTAYDAPTAQMLDDAGVDIVLVGDSVGNAVLGYENTLPVTVEEMCHHVKAVRRGAKNAFIVADVPAKGMKNVIKAAKRLKKSGANAVKIEGAVYSKISSVIKSGIPVMGHIGFTPQALKKLGGYKVQGRTLEAVNELISEAMNLAKIGVFAIVVEMVPANVGKTLSKIIKVPVISCGAGRFCDGQVLVVNDILGLSKWTPSFAKKYGNLSLDSKKAILGYMKDVKSGNFPDNDHSF